MGMFAHTLIIIMPGLNARGLQSVTMHYVYILWSYCLAGYTYTALHSSYHIGEPSLIPKLLLPCVYDTMIMQFYY